MNKVVRDGARSRSGVLGGIEIARVLFIDVVGYSKLLGGRAAQGRDRLKWS